MLTRSKTAALVFLALLACEIAVAHTEGIYNPQANSVGNFEGIDSNAPASGGGCTPGAAATNFLARTSALSPLETKATCTLINDLVSAGAITGNLSGAAGCGTVLDGFYFLATKDKTTAYLNLCGTSFGLIETATVTCTVDVGCAGDGATGFLDTQWNPTTNGVNFTQNSATLIAYIQSTIAVSGATAMGVNTAGGSAFTYMVPVSTGTFAWDLNGGVFPTFANTNSQGAWIESRTNSTTTSVYLNSATTSANAVADASNANAFTATMLLFARSNNGVATAFSNYQVSCFGFGGGVTSTMAFAINNACNHAMTVLGANHIY